MKEKKIISAGKMILHFIQNWLLWAIIINLASVFIQGLLMLLLKNTSIWLQTIINYIYSILIDFIVLVLTTTFVNRKYKINKDDQKKVNYCLIIMTILLALVSTYVSVTEYNNLIAGVVDPGFSDPLARLSSNQLQFMLVLYPIILIPRLIILLYPIAKLNVATITLETHQKPTIKIETEEPVYQQINTQTNEVVEGNVNPTDTNVWEDEIRKLDEKDILIVPQVKEEVKEEVPSIAIKPIAEVKPEVPVTEKTVDGIIKFEGLIPGVSINDNKKEEPKKVPTQPVSQYHQEERICPNCGAKVSENATTCFMCGKSL